MAATFLGCISVGASADPEDVRVPAAWDTSFTLRTGAGYKDNVTLAHLAPESSPYLSAGFDALITRLAVDTPRVNIFINGDHQQFLSAESVENEQLVSALAEARQFFGNRCEGSLAARYAYVHQVLDISVSETNRIAIPATAHGISITPGIQVDPALHYWIVLQLPMARQLYNDPLDDRWELDAKLQVGRNYGAGSEISLSYEPGWRLYDAELALRADGTPLPGTHRRFLQHEGRLRWRHDWDEARNWRSTTTLSVRVNDDHGSGYFDYTRFLASHELRFRRGAWEVSLGAGVSHYLYHVQTVSDLDLRKRERTAVEISLRCERRLARWLRLVAGYDHGQVFSNDEFETYAVNTVSGSLQWDF